MRENKNISFFYDYAKDKNGECLSVEYINTNSIINFRCHNKHEWGTKAVNIIYSNSWCPYCNQNTKDNIETFKKIAIERGGECLSDVYVNSKFKLAFKCKKGHIWNAIPESVKNSKHWCPVCGDTIPLTIESMKILAKERGGACLSTTYVNNNSMLEWMCTSGHTWFAPANRIKSAKTWCLECSGSKKKTIDLMQEIAGKRKGRCLSDVYIGAHSKLLWECEFGHQWWATYHDLNWCPICLESNGENIIRLFLIENNINFVKEKRFDDCRNLKPLPFDFYLLDFNICIEYDGAQHFKPNSLFGGDEGFKLRKLHDNIKNEYCCKMNLKLIRVPYFEKNINEFLEKSLIFYNPLHI